MKTISSRNFFFLVALSVAAWGFDRYCVAMEVNTLSAKDIYFYVESTSHLFKKYYTVVLRAHIRTFDRDRILRQYGTAIDASFSSDLARQYKHGAYVIGPFSTRTEAENDRKARMTAQQRTVYLEKPGGNLAGNAASRAFEFLYADMVVFLVCENDRESSKSSISCRGVEQVKQMISRLSEEVPFISQTIRLDIPVETRNRTAPGKMNPDLVVLVYENSDSEADGEVLARHLARLADHDTFGEAKVLVLDPEAQLSTAWPKYEGAMIALNEPLLDRTTFITKGNLNLQQFDTKLKNTLAKHLDQLIVKEALTMPNNVDSQSVVEGSPNSSDLFEHEKRECALKYIRSIRPLYFLTALNHVRDFQSLQYSNDQSQQNEIVKFVKFVADREESVIYFQNTTRFILHTDFALFANIDPERFGLDTEIPSDPYQKYENDDRFVKGTLVYEPCPKGKSHSAGILAFDLSSRRGYSKELMMDIITLLSQRTKFNETPLYFLCHDEGNCIRSKSILEDTQTPVIPYSQLFDD